MAAMATVAAAPLPVDEVAPGVYVHIGQHKDFDDGYDGDIANIGFIVGRDAVAVIDTGGSYAVGIALKAALRQITSLPIRYVINTHVHPDHVLGNAAFTGAEGVADPVFIGHAGLAQAMALNGDAYRRNLTLQLGAGAANSTLIAPSRSVADTLTLDLGARKLVLQAWPRAHSGSDLTLFDVASATLWSGDLLFIERTPSLDGDLHGWLAALDRLAEMPARATIPGHGPVTTDKNAALADQRRYLTLLLADVRFAIKNGIDMTQVMETAAATERAHWQLFDVVNRRNVNLIYPLLEWE
jgi:quinoprotein relay system zinc metallohydrolase 2